MTRFRERDRRAPILPSSCGTEAKHSSAFAGSPYPRRAALPRPR